MAKVYDKKKFKEAVSLVRLGEKSATSVIKEFKITPAMYYRWVKGLEKKRKEDTHR